jgi:putative hemolysin
VTVSTVLEGSWPLIGLMSLLLGVSAFFSSSETAAFSLGWSDMRRYDGSRARSVRFLQALLADRRGLLVTGLFGTLLINVLYFGLGVQLSSRFAQAGLHGAAVATPFVVLIAIVLMGEVLPKSLAVTWPGVVARITAEPLWWLQRLLFVPRVVLSFVAEAVGRLAVGNREDEGEIDEQELGALLELSAADGHLHPDELDALQEVLILAGLPVKDIMVPRVDVVGFMLSPDEPEAAQRLRFLDLVDQRRHSKIPVHGGSLDDVQGYVLVKDVLAFPEKALLDLVHPLAFVPETSSVSDVMERLLAGGPRLMVVVDQYGGTEGIVTEEDVVEAVVGDLADEEEPEAPVQREGGRSWLVDGRLGIRRVSRLFGGHTGKLPVSTLGGLVTHLLGHLPKVGDEVRAGRTALTVVGVRRHRASLVRIRLVERWAERLPEKAP